MASRKVPIFQGSGGNFCVTEEFVGELKEALLLCIRECELSETDQFQPVEKDS